MLLYLLEKGFGFHFEQSKKITYEKIELVTGDPESAAFAGEIQQVLLE